MADFRDMSKVADHDRVRELVRKLEEIQRESEHIRDRIEQIRGNHPEWPERRNPDSMFDDPGEGASATPSRSRD